MLRLDNIQSGYGETQVIYGLDLQVRAGRVHALLGRNGVGRTTILKTIVGLLPVMSGRILLHDKPLHGLPPFAIARSGVAYVPETRDIFSSLTVQENLQLAARMGAANQRRWTIDAVLTLFPNLAARRHNGGGQLSGGEQQMLAIARALLMNPMLLILDEPTEGLAPIITKQIYRTLEALKADGMTMVLVEQNFGFAAGLADEISIISRGRCVWSGTAAAVRADKQLQQRWLSV